MNNQDDITIQLYKALRELSTQVYMSGKELGLETQMSTALDTLEAAQTLIDELENKNRKTRGYR